MLYANVQLVVHSKLVYCRRRAPHLALLMLMSLMDVTQLNFGTLKVI